MNEDKELWERLTVVEQSTKSAHHRIDGLEDLTESVHTIAVEMKAMREDMGEVKTRVADIESKPIKRYDTIIGCIITLVVGAVVGMVLSRIGLG